MAVSPKEWRRACTEHALNLAQPKITTTTTNKLSKLPRSDAFIKTRLKISHLKWSKEKNR